MVYSEYTKKRILFYKSKGHRAPTIAKLLEREGIVVSRRGVDAFLDRVQQTGTIARRPGSSRPSKRTDEVKQIVEAAMRKDDETTVKEARSKLTEAGHDLSLSTTLRCRMELGWTVRGSAYCQMIRKPNKVKRLDWATEHLHEAETGFLDVIFTDETSIQMESHRRFCCLCCLCCLCCRKKGEAPKNKPRYIHTVIKFYKATCTSC